MEASRTKVNLLIAILREENSLQDCRLLFGNFKQNNKSFNIKMGCCHSTFRSSTRSKFWSRVCWKKLSEVPNFFLPAQAARQQRSTSRADLLPTCYLLYRRATSSPLRPYLPVQNTQHAVEPRRANTCGP